MSRFILERSHIDNGLSEQDITQYTGLPVILIDLARHPHWSSMLERQLSDEELRERTISIRNELQEKIRPLQKGDAYANHNFDMSSEVLAKQLGHIMIGDFYGRPFNGQSAGPFTHHYNILRQQGIGMIDEPCLHIVQNNEEQWMKHIAVAGTLNEEFKYKIYKKAASAIIGIINDDNEERIIKTTILSTGIEGDYPINIVGNKFENILSLLHEMRHLIQITLDPDNVIGEMYREMDSDLFAYQILKEAMPRILNQCEQRQAKNALDENMHIRYLNMLTMKTKYMFAPIMDALIAGEQPPNFYQVDRALRHLKQKTLLNSERKVFKEGGALNPANIIQGMLKDTSHSRTDKDNMTDSLFSDVARHYGMEYIFSVMCYSLDRGYLENPLANKIALKILNAVSAFGGNYSPTYMLRPKDSKNDAPRYAANHLQ